MDWKLDWRAVENARWLTISGDGGREAGAQGALQRLADRAGDSGEG